MNLTVGSIFWRDEIVDRRRKTNSPVDEISLTRLVHTYKECFVARRRYSTEPETSHPDAMNWHKKRTGEIGRLQVPLFDPGE